MAVGTAPSGSRSAEAGATGGLGLVAARPRRWPRRLLVLVNVVVLVMLALGASAYGYVQWRFGQVRRVSVSGLTPAGKGSQSPASAGTPMTLLVVGSDTRDLGKGASALFGTPEEVTGARSDTIMLVRVVPKTSSVALLSVPRDLLVNVPGLGTTRVNAAFGGGPNLLVSTVQQDLGIQVNHFVVVNFLTFTQIADAVGGVYQYFPAPARDLYSNLVVPKAGCVLLKGFQALAFVRSREYQYYSDGSWQYQLVPESDLARIQRQQDFMKLALKKAEQVAPTNPVALNSVISGITGSLTVDSGFSTSAMINLALGLRHTNVAGIPNWTYPTVNSTSVPGALGPDPVLDQQVVGEFLGYGMPAVHTTATAAAKSGNSVAPSSIVVRVLNGSGVAGQAGHAANVLEGLGFKVSATGDAANYNYNSSVIEYGPGDVADAKALEARIPGGAVLDEVNALPLHQLVLITGQSYSLQSWQPGAPGPLTEVHGQGTPVLSVLASYIADAPTSSYANPGYTPAQQSGTGEVEPDSSSYYHDQYIPPGLEPGQVPPTCPD
ncbi:MAG TPA: LCP family protein [Acidimicrobiales bacterium]|nr:LCP family protein [Acidimicrobiales bacterium]